MKFSDEILMAYADGMLDPASRAEIEAASARDPEVARAIERHRALAARVRGAYSEVLEEPVPAQLRDLVERSGAVDGLAARREARAARRERWQLPVWAAAAASLVAGLFIGVVATREPAAPYAQSGGMLVARGALDEALGSQLAAPAGDAGIAIGISFRNRDGAYCRTFRLQHEAAVAGLACRGARDWRIEVLAAAASGRGELTPAASLPLAVLETVDATIDGEPLDHAAEVAARDAGWLGPSNVAE